MSIVWSRRLQQISVAVETAETLVERCSDYVLHLRY
jgi:hypothetical protein